MCLISISDRWMYRLLICMNNEYTFVVKALFKFTIHRDEFIMFTNNINQNNVQIY